LLDPEGITVQAACRCCRRQERRTLYASLLISTEKLAAM
jgi:hypothetical protein